MPIHSAVFASLSCLLLLGLGLRTTQLRWRYRTFAGFGGHEDLARASRAHGVSFEHLMPLMLLLLFYEVLGGPKWVVDVFGCVILAGRALQVAGYAANGRWPRVAGMTVTYTLEGVLAMVVLMRALARW